MFPVFSICKDFAHAFVSLPLKQSNRGAFSNWCLLWCYAATFDVPHRTFSLFLPHKHTRVRDKRSAIAAFIELCDQTFHVHSHTYTTFCVSQNLSTGAFPRVRKYVCVTPSHALPCSSLPPDPATSTIPPSTGLPGPDGGARVRLSARARAVVVVRPAKMGRRPRAMDRYAVNEYECMRSCVRVSHTVQPPDHTLRNLRFIRICAYVAVFACGIR